MTLTKLTAAIVAHLDALHNLATWLARDSAEAYALVRSTCQQAIHMMPEPHAGTNLRVGLLTIMWGLYRQGHTLSTDGANEAVMEHVAADKRLLFHTLSRADLDTGLRQLPEVLRAALILSDMEGYPLEDVAAIIGLSKPKTQGALSKARQLLDGILQARLATTTVSPESEAKNSP
jgi:DNA-directed RNA polymerase specialized sigma24 family protein